jgi:integrase
MTRQPTGQVIEDPRRPGAYGLRFRASGKRRYQGLGRCTPAEAEAELQNILADVRRGIWRPPAPPPVTEAPRVVPTFHEFACQWFERQKLEGGQRGRGLSRKGIEDLEWRLSNHLLPAFAHKRLDAFTIQDVDGYRLAKVREGALGPTSINKTLNTLAAILETAAEYELIGRNPARGRRRRLPAVQPRRSWLDRAEHIAALLDGAGELDRDARVRRGQRRALLATLVFAGLRIGEALALRWRDVDLARGTIVVRAAKTRAGERMVNIVPVLRDELLRYRMPLAARAHTNAEQRALANALVFATSKGTALTATNVRRRILAKAVRNANWALTERGSELLQPRLTPHSLRRTFASLLFAIAEQPPYVMAQMGHTTANLTLTVYAREMDRRDGEPERLRALVEGRGWAASGQQGAEIEVELGQDLAA